MAENDIARIAAQADLPAIASNFTTVKAKGKEYVATCVFHSPDKNPSLSIFQKNGKWQFKCFSCGEGGDAIDWFEKLEGLDTAGALKRLNGGNEWKPNFKAPPRAEPLPDRLTSKPPPGTAPPDFTLRAQGKPVRTWEYRDIDGATLGYVARYEVDGKKDIIPWTWGSRGSAAPSWGCGQFNKPRPLYNLDQLVARQKALVLLVEGEKSAFAAAPLLKDYVATTWPGGVQAWKHADFTPLRGREVLIWPDNDKAGIEPMQHVAKFISDPRTLACRVRVIDPTGQADGWDIADASEEGWDTKRLFEWAKPRAADYHHIVEQQHGLPEDLPPLEAYASEATTQQAGPPAKANVRNVVDEVFYRRMSEIELLPTLWLWKGRIAKGAVSMLVGNPGLGKSQVCASIASVVSNGGSWPVDRERCEAGSVVLLSAEDDPERTIAPRLKAAGADLSKIHILDWIRVTREDGDGKRGFDLGHDVPKLAALIAELQDVALVVIDPVTAYLGEADSHKNAEVRALLAQLAEMASTHNVSVLAVSHLTKSSGMEALLRVQGSIGFAAAARAVWGVAKDKENPSRRLFMPLKNNLGTDVSGFAYSVEGIKLQESGIETSHVMWESQAVTMTVDEVFSHSDESHEEKDAMLEAKMFLRSLLADGPVDAKIVEADARGAGHAITTLGRALKALGGTRKRSDGVGGRGKWVWRL